MLNVACAEYVSPAVTGRYEVCTATSPLLGTPVADNCNDLEPDCAQELITASLVTVPPVVTLAAPHPAGTCPTVSYSKFGFGARFTRATGPCGPVAPVGPLGPATPWEPCGPCGPAPPWTPALPLGPVGP